MDMLNQLVGALGAEIRPVDEACDHHRAVLPESRVTVDITGTTAPTRTVFLLPGGGLNAVANYFTAQGRSLARFFADHGCLVVGITPREDALAPDEPVSEAVGWGLASHRADAEAVVRATVSATGLPYDLLGHSAGAALALDLASHLSSTGGPDPLGFLSPSRVLVLDTTGPYDPATEAELVERAGMLTDHCAAQLAAGGQLLDPGLAGLFARAAAEPTASTPVPRPVAETSNASGTSDRSNRSDGSNSSDGSDSSNSSDGSDAGTFTNLGLLHFALVRTGSLPGPVNWIYRRGHSSGSYSFGPSPAEDRFTLDRSPLAVWAAAVERLGSGLQPLALLRDLAALWAGREEVYRIDWAAVRAEVVWVNAELGRGDHDRGARLIRESGGRVDYRVVPGYGHGDLVWSTTAEQDVWRSLLPKS